MMLLSSIDSPFSFLHIFLAKYKGPCVTFNGDGPRVKFQQDGYDPAQSTLWAEEQLQYDVH